jgi:lysozyme family protein
MGTPVDGEISGQVYAQRAFFPNPAPVCSWEEYGSAVIRKLQAYLNKKRIYGTLELDGLLGKQTVTSLQKFLVNDVNSKAQIGVDGIWGGATSKAFQKFLNTR